MWALLVLFSATSLSLRLIIANKIWVLTVRLHKAITRLLCDSCIGKESGRCGWNRLSLGRRIRGGTARVDAKLSWVGKETITKHRRRTAEAKRAFTARGWYFKATVRAHPTAEKYQGPPGIRTPLWRTKMMHLRLELKICEGCGALWLRTGVSDGPYCARCKGRLAGFPAARGKRGGGRPRLARVAGCCAASRKTAGAQ